MTTANAPSATNTDPRKPAQAPPAGVEVAKPTPPIPQDPTHDRATKRRAESFNRGDRVVHAENEHGAVTETHPPSQVVFVLFDGHQQHTLCYPDNLANEPKAK